MEKEGEGQGRGGGEKEDTISLDILVIWNKVVRSSLLKFSRL